jgi:hypothetical protein
VPQVAARITVTYSGSRERRCRPPPGGVGGEDCDGIVFYRLFSWESATYLWLVVGGLVVGWLMGELSIPPGDKRQNDASMGRWNKFLVKLNLL